MDWVYVAHKQVFRSQSRVGGVEATSGVGELIVQCLNVSIAAVRCLRIQSQAERGGFGTTSVEGC